MANYKLSPKQIAAIAAKNKNKSTPKKTKSKTTKSKNTSSKSLNNKVNEATSEIFSLSSKNDNGTISRNVENSVKKLPLKSKICIIILFLIGIALSIGTCFFICRNDCFELIGKKNITLFVGEEYFDEGVKAIGFGKDLSDKVTIEIYKNETKIEDSIFDIKTSEECSYQTVYKISNFRYRNVQVIRNVNVLNKDIVEPDKDIGILIDLFKNPTSENLTLEDLIGTGQEKESEVEYIYILNNKGFVLINGSTYSREDITSYCDYNFECLETDFANLEILVNAYNNNKINDNWVEVLLVKAT